MEAGSFNRAAEHLEVSAVAVSRRVSGLENVLGVKLLNRTTRQVALAEAGRQFYADVVNIIASLEEAAIQGLGIVLMPAFIVEDAIADGRLKAILQDYCPIPFGLYAVRPSRRFTPERVRILIEFLRGQIGDVKSKKNITHN